VGNQGPSSVSESGETTLSTRAQGYYNSFMDIVDDELYYIPTQLESANAAALSAYLEYLGGDCSGSCTS
jgi:hypothetical protein